LLDPKLVQLFTQHKKANAIPIVRSMKFFRTKLFDGLKKLLDQDSKAL